jgi:hypothetical protein
MRRAAMLTLAAAALAASPAHAAETFGAPDIGQPFTGTTHCANLPCSIVDRTYADGSSDAGSPIDGVLVTVRMRYAGDGADAAFRVLRPTTTDTFLNVGPEMQQQLPASPGAGTVLSFPVRHVIRAGDRLGLGADVSFAGDSYLSSGAPRACLLRQPGGSDGLHPADSERSS